ncbi:hypothetical protein REPUB_Repub03eG0264300 [Reevesia pubescens]
MASKVIASSALFLSLNLLFFALVSSHNAEYPLKNSSNSRNKNPVVIRPGAKYPNGNGYDNQGLADLEAAVCLCTAIRANVLGINLNLPISLSLLLNNYGRRDATEYICSQ